MEQNQDVEVLKEKILEQLINFTKEKTEAEVQPEDKLGELTPDSIVYIKSIVMVETEFQIEFGEFVLVNSENLTISDLAGLIVEKKLDVK